MTTQTIVFFVLGLSLLFGGAELLVKGASRLAATLGISPLVIGLTVVAFGTSAPELAVSVQGAMAGKADLAIGNVVGSNIFNILVILGLASLVTPLVVAQKLIRVDVPLMIGASLLVLLLALDGVVGRADGLLLFAGIVAYTTFAIRQSRRESREVAEEYEREVKAEGTRLANVTLIVVGLVLLVLGSRWMVEGAVAIARVLGVSELVIALTIIATGTSLPEVATSVVASVRGERDIAVGNVVGSNLFNLLCVLGATALVSPRGVAVPAEALEFDIPVMIAVAIACLPVFFTGHSIARWEGALFLLYYVAYVGLLVARAMNHEALPPPVGTLLLFTVPLAALSLLLWFVRGQRGPPRAPASP